MTESSFRIRLPERDELEMTVAEFPLLRSSDASANARRTKMLGALAKIDEKVRNKLAKAVAESCRWFIAADRHAVVSFGLAEHEGKSAVKIVVAVKESVPSPNGSQAGPEFTKPETNPSTDAIEKSANALDHFELSGFPESPSITLVQTASTNVNLTPKQVQLWAELLSAKSPEDAVAIAQHGRQLSNSELQIRRSYGTPSNEVRRAASDRADLETLSLVANRAPVAIFIMSELGRIQWANPTFESQTGYSVAESIDRRFDELAFGPSTGRDIVRNFQQALQNGHEFANDVLIYRQNGQTAWSELKLIPVPVESGRNSRWIGLLGDVTKRRRTEEASSSEAIG